MATFRMGEAARLLGVGTDAVRRWADDGRFRTTRSSGGHRLIEGVDLAAFAVELAGDSGSDATVSARNQFEGLVTRVVVDGVMAQVELQAGPFRIVSLISAEAVEDLGLEPGVMATARVKATNVVVERS